MWLVSGVDGGGMRSLHVGRDDIGEGIEMTEGEVEMT